MNRYFSMLLSLPALVALPEVVQACPWQEQEGPIDCGGRCGRHKILETVSCYNSDNGCDELRTLEDMIVCKYCPEEASADINLCGAGGCSCGDQGS